MNGKIYVGQTKSDLLKRFRYHCYKYSGCCALVNAIKKYGRDNFTIEQIDVANSQNELDEKERYWITVLNSIVPNGYNLKSGGNCPTYSEESRTKMSVNHADVSGNKNPNFGRKHSDEVKEKLRRSKVDTHLNMETRQKISQKMGFPVLNVNTKEIFQSARECERFYGFSHDSVAKVCRGISKSTHGFRFVYLKEGDVNHVKSEVVQPSD